MEKKKGRERQTDRQGRRTSSAWDGRKIDRQRSDQQIIQKDRQIGR